MLRNLICIEELHLLTAIDSDRSDLSEMIVPKFAREGRAFGFGCAVVDQIPSLVPIQIVGNCNTIISLRLISGRDTKSVADSMGLSEAQRQFLLEVPPQTCVARISAYPKAFVVRIPDIQREDISEEEISRATAAVLSGFIWKERYQLAGEESAPRRSREVVPKDEQDYLIYRANHPELTCTIADRKFGVSTWKGNSLRRALGKRGFITTFNFATGRKGGVVTIVVITAAGYEFLQNIKAKVKPLGGMGGPLHRIGQIWIKQNYERMYPGCEATIEEQLENGKRVDVDVRLGERRTAVELLVEGVEKETGNIAKVLASDLYDELVLVAADEDSLSKLREAAAEATSDTPVGKTAISFKLLGEFLPEKLS